MPVYLSTHPPARRQFEMSRGRNPTGVIVVHTAESVPDFNPPDDGAENVARFIATRADPGSYHSLADSDGIVRLCEYAWLAYGCRVGNAWSLHLSAACRTTDFGANAMWVHNVIWNLAAEAKAMAAWCKALYGIGIPARRITHQEFLDGRPGFIAHSDADPGWHSDPGPSFPWGQFLSFYSDGDTPMATADPLVLNIQKTLNAAGVQPPLKEDGLLGPKTAQAVADVVSYQQWRMTEDATALRGIVDLANKALTP